MGAGGSLLEGSTLMTSEGRLQGAIGFRLQSLGSTAQNSGCFWRMISRLNSCRELFKVWDVPRWWSLSPKPYEP